MMHRILLVAAREFRQIAVTRSFWITMLIVPLGLAIGPFAGRLMDTERSETVTVIDPSGRVAPEMAARLARNEERRLLEALSDYAERHDLDRADPRAVWARHADVYTDADVAAFVQAGGAARAIAAMRRVAPPGTRPFTPPVADFRWVPPPAALVGAPVAQLERAGPALVHQDAPPRERRDYVVYIAPATAAAPVSARIWADHAPSDALMGVIQDVLTHRLRTDYLRGRGLDAAAAEAADRIAPRIAVTTPPPGHGQEAVVIRSVLPLLTSYMLLMSLMVSGSWMLQGTVEERSNKLMETLLACVSPDELLYGKLVGTVTVGLTMVGFWVACAAAAAIATQGMFADLLRPALAPLAQPEIALAMLYYFLVGYLMIAMIFLAIGAMSDSVRDAQAYLSPVLLVIALPYAVVAQAVLNDPSSLAVRIISWVPVYAPFTMLARLGAGVPAWELIGSGLVLAAFVAGEVVLLGRVFRASLLNAGSKPSFARLRGMIAGRE